MPKRGKENVVGYVPTTKAAGPAEAARVKTCGPCGRAFIREMEVGLVLRLVHAPQRFSTVDVGTVRGLVRGNRAAAVAVTWEPVYVSSTEDRGSVASASRCADPSLLRTTS